jgi:hypothetical protein
MRLISQSVSAVTGKVLGKKYHMLGRIITQWEDIVGKDLSANAAPCRLIYRKKNGNKTEFTLEIAANSSQATLLSYRTDLILQRLSRIVGQGVITAIRFVPASANQDDQNVALSKPRLTNEEKNTMTELVSRVEDADIREKLLSLGTSILKDKKKKN